MSNQSEEGEIGSGSSWQTETLLTGFSGLRKVSTSNHSELKTGCQLGLSHWACLLGMLGDFLQT